MSTYNNEIEKQKEMFSFEQVIRNTSDFIKEHASDLEYHYNCIINNGLAKNYYIYEDIDLTQYNVELLNVSVVIITANYFESEILNYNVYNDNNKKIRKLKEGINLFPNENFKRVDAYIMEINKYTVLHLHAPETGSNTPCGSADLVRYVSNNINIAPSCIISFGICYGINPKEQSLTDTIIAKKIYPCSIGIKVCNQKWHIKHDDYILNLENRYPDLYYQIDEVVRGRRNKITDRTFQNVQIGNMLSGEAVINDEKFKLEAINAAHGYEILCGEMEGYGLTKECIFYSNVPCLIIKSICDWGVLKNIENYLPQDIPENLRVNCKEKIQAYAVYCAYKVLNKLFYENVFENNSVCMTVENEIWNNYYINGYIQDEILRSKITEILQKKLYIRKKKFALSDIDNIVEMLITNCFVNKEKLYKKQEDGIIGYMFS